MNKEKYKVLENDEQFYIELCQYIESVVYEIDLSKEDWKKLSQKLKLLISYTSYCNKNVRKVIKTVIRNFKKLQALGYNIDKIHCDTAYEFYDNLKQETKELRQLKNIVDQIHESKCYYVLDSVIELLGIILTKDEEINNCVSDIYNAIAYGTEYDQLSHVRYRRLYSNINKLYDDTHKEVKYNLTRRKKR